MALSVFQAAASRGFDGLFSGSFFLVESVWTRDFVLKMNVLYVSFKGSSYTRNRGEGVGVVEFWPFETAFLSPRTEQEEYGEGEVVPETSSLLYIFTK